MKSRNMKPFKRIIIFASVTANRLSLEKVVQFTTKAIKRDMFLHLTLKRKQSRIHHSCNSSLKILSPRVKLGSSVSQSLVISQSIKDFDCSRNSGRQNPLDQEQTKQTRKPSNTIRRRKIELMLAS